MMVAANIWMMAFSLFLVVGALAGWMQTSMVAPTTTGTAMAMSAPAPRQTSGGLSFLARCRQACRQCFACCKCCGGAAA